MASRAGVPRAGALIGQAPADVAPAPTRAIGPDFEDATRVRLRAPGLRELTA